MFNYLVKIKPEKIENAFIVLGAEFVTAEDGTGIVHINPMHGEDDFVLSEKYNLPMYHLVSEDGLFKQEVKDYANEFVKEADKKIIADLKTKYFL